MIQYDYETQQYFDGVYLEDILNKETEQAETCLGCTKLHTECIYCSAYGEESL